MSGKSQEKQEQGIRNKKVKGKKLKVAIENKAEKNLKNRNEREFVT